MSTGTLISVEEYLRTSYSPDMEYVDGELVEINVANGSTASFREILSVPFSSDIARPSRFLKYAPKRGRPVTGSPMWRLC
jgi:hypothetical protein